MVLVENIQEKFQKRIIGNFYFRGITLTIDLLCRLAVANYTETVIGFMRLMSYPDSQGAM